MKNENIENIYPLTPLQEGILFHALRMEDSHVYTDQMSMTLNAPLNPKFIQESFQLLTQKYDVLRASIVHEKTPRPLHVIKRKVEVPFQHYNLEGLNDEQIDEEIQRIKEEDRSKGFEFKKGPLFRLNYIDVNDRKSVLIFTFHHIILDGWSVAIIIKDFYNFYISLIEKQQPKIESVVQFNEYIKHLDTTDKNKALEYWKNYLNEYATLASFAQKSDSESNFSYTAQQFHLSSEAQKGIEKFMSQFDITFPVAMQFLWGIMLSRLSLHDDVVFGTIVSGRSVDVEQIESMVGMTINTIPVRLRFDESPLEDQLIHFRKASFESLSYQNSSLSDIQNLTGLPALFDQLLVFENYPYDELDSSQSLQVTEVDVLEKTNYRFLINFTYGAETIVKINYDNALYSDKMISQLEEILNHLAEIIPDSLTSENIHSLPLIPESINKEIEIFNETDFELPQETLVSLFAKGVQEYPKRIAVTDQHRNWTYKELDQHSTVIAAELLAKGVQLEESVCLHVERSNFMMAAILGVLKAGATYVPIDPTIPSKRKAFIQNDSLATYVLVEDTLMDSIDWVEKEQIIVLNSLDYNQESQIELPRVQPENLAYIIYTSGSTGQPKGVMVEHQSINNRLQWMQKEYPLKENDRIVQKTNYAFDVSLEELFGWMFAGASLHFLKPGGEKDPGIIFDFLVNKEITRVHFVPSMHAIFLEYIQAFEDIGKLHRLNYVFSSGEGLSKDVIDKFNELIYPKTQAVLMNMYGPTETTVEVTSYEYPTDEVPHEISIGKPIDNTKLYILDAHLNPMPIGFSGEIYVEGIQVARGYIGRKKLTREVFFESPFNKGRRMYKTGDVGFWNSDGTIQCLGRKDGQVKLRGYRIELNEITLTLKSFGTINHAAVMIHDEKLIGFYAGEEANSQVLQGHMQSLLPEYMVPGHYIYIKDWPINSNGKTDSKALKQYFTTLENPKTATEYEKGILADIWKGLLKVEHVSSNDNFFASGGHSLLAIRLMAQIRKKLAVEIHIKDIFYHPTFGEIQQLISESQAKTTQEIKKYTGKNAPLTGAQQRIFVLYDLLNKDATYHIPSVWEVQIPLDKDKLMHAVSQVIKRHEILRTGFSFDEQSGIFQQNVAEKITFQIDWEKSEEVSKYFETYCEEELRAFIKPFVLDSAPLFRMKVVSLSESRHLLFFDVHHIIFDGPSFQIFFQDLLAFYKGEIVKPLKLQFKDYAAHIQQQITGGKNKASKEFWMQQFSKGIPVLNFPEANTRVATQGKRGKVIHTRIDSDQKNKLQDLSKQLNLTLNQLLFGMYVLLLMKKSKQHEIIIGSTVNTREAEETLPLIGMFANTVAIPVYNKARWTLEQFFHYVKEQLVGALSHKEYPFEQLVKDLDVERDVTRTPLFDVMYSMEPGLEDETLNGQVITPIKLKEKAISFDMSFFVNEYADHLQVFLEYDGHLFQDDWSQNVLDSWMKMTDEISNRLHQNVFEFCDLSAKEHTVIQDIKVVKESTNGAVNRINNSEEYTTKVAAIWESLLKQKPITGNEDFFKVGGHSILAVRLSILLHKETGIKIPLIQIFKEPSFHQIVAYLKNHSTDEIDDIQSIPKAAFYELSQAQKRMWVTHEMGTQKHAYNLTVTYKLSGDINPEKFKVAFQKIVQEQEILRSYYQLVDGEPKMFIHEDSNLDWEEKNLMSFENPNKEATHICQERFSKGFDLSEDALLRVGLYQTEDKTYWMNLVCHHIIVDGWSLRILVERFIQYYENAVSEKQEIFQYQDFAYWQNERLQGEYGNELKDYWNGKFEKPLRIAQSKAMNGQLSVGETKLSFFSQDVYQHIQKNARQYNCSNYQFLLGTLGVVLCHTRKSQEQLILFSDTGRVHPKLEKMMGFFINTLPFRYQLVKEESIQEMTSRIQREVLADLDHAELPLDDIVKYIKVDGTFDKSLLNTRLVYNDFDYGEPLKIQGIEAEEQRVTSDAGKFDLSITMSPFGEKLSVQMEYNTSLYSDEDLEKLLTLWKDLIANISQNPEITVGKALEKVHKKQSASSMKMSLNALKNIQVETIQMEGNES